MHPVPISAVAVMARAPSRDGKSRLAGHLKPADLDALRQALLADALSVARQSGLPTFVFATPDDAVAELAAAAPQIPTLTQGDGDLGVRMHRAIQRLLALGHGAAIVIGTDVPLLTRAELTEAQALVDDDTVVLGPATDGGYYLLATSRDRPALFSAIPWGTVDVFDRTVRRAVESGCRVAPLKPLPDLDTPDDLERTRDALRHAAHDVAPSLRQWFAERVSV